ncbi:TolC family protein [Hufsiella ginkgonis]|uniref:TolC family protein n=1 Tax=Hufsiella ginkgonis TaxID=2695274 RepID=A0A7K1XTR1_9SPHI|nr:TolC family protein [Hufsiella ginkgonis]MXV14364.1 TolC family protein [Hufsiella ginkgonis]
MISKLNFSVRGKAVLILLSALLVSRADAQTTKTITLAEAIRLGLENSKTLKLSQARIDAAISEYNQAKDNVLPSAKASYAYNHAEIPTNTLRIGDGDPIHLPNRADAFIGTVSVQELLFAGNKLRYARESTELLTSIARADATQDKDNVIYGIISAYYNLYKVQQSKEVVRQNLESADKQLKQATRFFDQGVVTRNDVLRFQLQKSNVEVTGIDLESNRRIVNYDLNVLLGLPENTELVVADFMDKGSHNQQLAAYIDSALTRREEVKTADLRTRIAETNIKFIHADQYPTIGVGANLYYINAGGKVFPVSNSFVLPISIGATVSWNFDKLWMNKNKIAGARIQKTEAEIGRELSVDQVKTDVNRNYQNYRGALDRIRIYETQVTQATENDKILESKYRNSVASVTDRVDAGTQLFQAQINLELAKADAALAWYNLLKSTGTITQAQTN